MLLESETDLVLALGVAAAAFAGLAVLAIFLLLRALSTNKQLNDELSKIDRTAMHNEKRLFDILNSIPVALVETDLTGRFTFANRAAHQLLGRKGAELIGLRFHSATWGITYPDGRVIPPDLLPNARALRGQTVRGFQHLIANPGTRKRMLVSVTAMPVTNPQGEVIGSTAALVETESLTPEQRGEADPLVQRYFEIAGVMLLALNPDGKVRDINLRGAEILGGTVEDVVGKDWIDQFLPPEHRENAKAFFRAVVEGREEMPDEGEGWIVRLDGERRLISWRGAVMRDGEGKIVATLSSGEDVTQARAAEKELREAESDLRLAQEAGGVGVWTFDSRTGELTNSAHLLKLWGFPADYRLTEDEQFGMLDPADRPAVERSLRGAWNGEGPYEAEYRVHRRDGSVRWIAARGEVIRDSAGHMTGMHGVSFDVTALKEAQAAVRESEQRFSELADAAPVLVWLGGPEGGCTWVNRTWLEFTGRALEQELGTGWTESVHPEDRERVRGAFEEALARREPFRMEFRLRRRDGEWRCIDDHGAPRFAADGSFLGWIGSCVDVTDAREATESLRASDERFRGFAEMSEDVVWLADAKAGRLEYVSPAYERMFGDDREAVMAEPGRWRALVHPEDRATAEEGARAVARGERAQTQYRVVRPDGQVRVVKNSSFPIWGEDGSLRWIAGLVHDVTESALAQEELERRVAERTRELEASLEERRKTEAALAQAQRLETVGRLTGGVAHDFNNLLTVIIGALDMILRQSDKPERVKRLGEAALAAGRRGERLTRQLLAFSRRQEMKLETLDLGGVIRGFESLLRRAAGEAAPTEVAVDERLGTGRIDPVQFEAALLNLLVNARDAVEEKGSGTISVRAERVRLAAGELTDVEAGEYARIQVSDTGVGMPPEVAARALEPFFTTKEVGKGTGLGLAQVYGFARQSGGGVRIDSRPGEGSTVSLFLPVSDADESAPEPQAPRDERPLERGKLVLLVEDDAGVRTVAENLLLELGCQVITAEDAAAALRILRTTPQIELLLTDVVMPGGMSGVDLAGEARRLRPELKVLLSTGYASDKLDEESRRTWEVLPKPYQADELSQAVRRALA